jgi:hypothetical protein
MRRLHDEDGPNLAMRFFKYILGRKPTMTIGESPSPDGMNHWEIDEEKEDNSIGCQHTVFGQASITQHHQSTRCRFAMHWLGFRGHSFLARKCSGLANHRFRGNSFAKSGHSLVRRARELNPLRYSCLMPCHASSAVFALVAYGIGNLIFLHFIHSSRLVSFPSTRVLEPRFLSLPFDLPPQERSKKSLTSVASSP